MAADEIREKRLKYLTDEKRIKAVTVLFSDLEGRLHLLDYDKKFLLGAYENLTFDGSSIRGFTAQKESDLRLGIDWSAFYWVPADVFGNGKVLVFGSAVSLARQRYDRRAQMAGFDRQRRRDAARPALARRSAAGFAAAGREKLTAGNLLSEKLTMRLSQRLVAAAVLVALSSALVGCSSSLGSWDPTDLLDVFDTKKKLPGERKEVFPDGVPGLEQGVPKELYKGTVEQQQRDQQNAEAAAAAAPPAEEPKTKKSKAKAKGKRPATASTAPAAAADPSAAPGEEGGAAAVPPAPKPKKTARRRTTAPPPDQEAPPAQPGPSSQQSAQPFPAPVPGGSFSR